MHALLLQHHRLRTECSVLQRLTNVVHRDAGPEVRGQGADGVERIVVGVWYARNSPTGHAGCGASSRASS
jgi:hypothetical protein